MATLLAGSKRERVGTSMKKGIRHKQMLKPLQLESEHHLEHTNTMSDGEAQMCPSNPSNY